jgi:hypothetical protein
MRKKKDTVPVTFRIPIDTLVRAEQEAELQAVSGYKPDRTDVLRVAVARGLELMKREREIVAERNASPKRK